jgi:F-type H+-transporting ATPase subunit delta
MRKMTAREWAKTLHTLTADATKEQITERVTQFTALLRIRRATKLVPRIMTAFTEISNAAQGIVHVKTSAAHALSKEIESQLKESYGSEVVIDHTIDPHAIGGLRLQVGDMIIDGTIKTALQKLYEN